MKRRKSQSSPCRLCFGSGLLQWESATDAVGSGGWGVTCPCLASFLSGEMCSLHFSCSLHHADFDVSPHWPVFSQRTQTALDVHIVIFTAHMVFSGSSGAWQKVVTHRQLDLQLLEESGKLLQEGKQLIPSTVLASVLKILIIGNGEHENNLRKKKKEELKKEQTRWRNNSWNYCNNTCVPMGEPSWIFYCIWGHRLLPPYRRWSWLSRVKGNEVHKLQRLQLLFPSGWGQPP